jgi:hypothetical protein
LINLLDGEVEIFATDNEAYSAALAVRAEELESLSLKEKEARIKEMQRTYIKTYGTMVSGGTIRLSFHIIR